MHWELLNEKLEEAYRVGFEKGHELGLLDGNLDPIITDNYVDFLIASYPNKEKIKL